MGSITSAGRLGFTILKMNSLSVVVCSLVIAMGALSEAYPRRGNGEGRRGRGGHPGGPRVFVPCLRVEEVDGVNQTTYDHPCTSSVSEDSLFQCVSACRHANALTPGKYTSYCRPKPCTSDNDCPGDSECVERGRHGRMGCTIDDEHRHFVRACHVEDDAGNVVHSRPCLEADHECESSDDDQEFTLDSVNYRAHYCQNEDSGED